MSAMAVADIGSIHGVCHQQIDESTIERPPELEQLQIRKCCIHISSDSGEPHFFLPFIPTFLTLDLLLRRLGPLERFDVSGFCQREFVSNSPLPHLCPRVRRDTSPPEISSTRFSNGLVPVGNDVLFPDPEKCGLRIIAYALNGSSFRSPFLIYNID